MEFPQIGIQCTKKKDIEANLEKRKKINVNPFLQEVNMSEIDLNVVKLCFQVKRIIILQGLGVGPGSHSRPEGHHRLTSRGRPWDKGLDSIVTETIKKNYQNQYLPWGIIPLLMSVLVTNGWNFKKKIHEAYMYKKIFEITIIRLTMAEIKQFSIIQAFTAHWEIKDKEMASVSNWILNFIKMNKIEIKLIQDSKIKRKFEFWSKFGVILKSLPFP